VDVQKKAGASLLFVLFGIVGAALIIRSTSSSFNATTENLSYLLSAKETNGFNQNIKQNEFEQINKLIELTANSNF
jgi:hypothetical protein